MKLNDLREVLAFEHLDTSPRGILEFFIAPTEGYPAALLRILLGLFGLWKSFGNWINFDRYFTESGIVPWRVVADSEHQVFSILSLSPESRSFSAYVIGLGCLASATLLLGLRARLSAALVFLVNVALMHRNPFIDNRGDHLFVLIIGLSVMLPLGHVWSLDSLIRRWRRIPRPSATMWGQRLIALQVSYIYLYAFGVKLRSPGWHDGSAIYHTFATPGLVEWPTEITFTPLLLAVAWSTIAFEMLFPILVWNPKARPYCLIAGTLFHLGIEVTMRIPVFSTMMVITYASFLTDGEIKAICRRVGLGRLLGSSQEA